MHTLDQLLSRIVERRGFTVQGTDPEALFAKKGDETLLAAWKTDGPLTTADAQLFVSAMDQLHATTGILVAPKGFDQAAKELVATKGVDVWAESRLVLEVGEAFVHDAILAPAAAPAVPAATAGAPTRYPTSAAGPGAVQPGAGPNHPTTKFPSLVAQAATVSGSGNNHGNAYFMPNKPKAEVPADMKATIQQSRGGSLGYAWGGSTGGQTSAPGVAQIRSGRHPSRKTDQWGNLLPPDQQPGAITAAASPALVNEDDVEIVSTPRGGKAAAASRSSPARAAPMPVTDAESEAYEIITTPKKGPAAPVAQQAPACNTLRLNVSKEQAVALSNAKAGAIVKLALVPHVAFEYDLHLERPGIAPVAAKGALLASSLTGELRNVDGALAWADSEPQGARKDQEKLTAVDLYEKVKGHMLKTYSKTTNVEREVAGNTVMETVKIVPDPDEMGLQHRGIVYVPVWEITGGGVNARVDAFTGTPV